jgi:dimethylamine monooxygenase subunit A
LSQRDIVNRLSFGKHPSVSLVELFPHADYRFQLRFERGEPADFFASTGSHMKLVAERRQWLRTEPQICAALLPPGEALLDEVAALASVWNGFTSPNPATPWQKCLALGEFWEADYLLLKCDPDNEIRLYGGCLCFPSSWRLSDKLGKPIEFIHGPVPGLNARIGQGIHKFLAALKPGSASLRHNWGLSRSPELNHHPDRALPRLDATIRVEEVWLRVEHQALVALPKSGGILFGIRVVNYPLTEVKADSVAAGRMCRSLETMPEEMARYKGLAAARGRIIELLHLR